LSYLFGGITGFLAVYGAILSSIGFGWNLYRDLLDRPKLKISANVRRLARGVDGKGFAVKPDLQVQGASVDLFVVMSVVNVGRRPVQWEGWGGKYFKPVHDRDGFVVIGRDLPKMLKEGETHAEFSLLEDDLRPANDNVKSLMVWDSYGKNWKLSKRELKKLRAEARAARSSANTGQNTDGR
jgi:hypothetical protein